MMNTEEKTQRLIKMIEEDNPFLAIVFCNKREGAVRLSYELTAAGLNIAEMHGDLTQGRRTQILRDFAKAKTQILVATDIAARGIDIEGITHVYNYDVPRDVDYYIHRIGRTGRAGNSGVAVTFATPQDESWLRRIERAIQATLTKYTKDGQIKTKGNASAAPKRAKNQYLANLRLQVPINLQRLKLIKLVAIKVLIHANAVLLPPKLVVVANADKIQQRRVQNICTRLFIS